MRILLGNQPPRRCVRSSPLSLGAKLLREGCSRQAKRAKQHHLMFIQVGPTDPSSTTSNELPSHMSSPSSTLIQTELLHLVPHYTVCLCPFATPHPPSSKLAPDGSEATITTETVSVKLKRLRLLTDTWATNDQFPMDLTWRSRDKLRPNIGSRCVGDAASKRGPSRAPSVQGVGRARSPTSQTPLDTRQKTASMLVKR